MIVGSGADARLVSPGAEITADTPYQYLHLADLLAAEWQTLGVVIRQALHDDPDVTAADIRAIIAEAIADASVVRAGQQGIRLNPRS